MRRPRQSHGHERLRSWQWLAASAAAYPGGGVAYLVALDADNDAAPITEHVLSAHEARRGRQKQDQTIALQRWRNVLGGVHSAFTRVG